MILPYTELPDMAGGWPRPLLDVEVGGMEDVLLPWLLDSGWLHSLLPRWVADASGIALEDRAASDLAVAAGVTHASFVRAHLAAAGETWEADIGFCDPWPYSWGLLGQLSFFRFFTVVFRAADFQFELEALAE